MTMSADEDMGVERANTHTCIQAQTGDRTDKEPTSLKAQLRAPGNKSARGKVLFTYLSPLRMERVGRAGALMCLTATDLYSAK